MPQSCFVFTAWIFPYWFLFVLKNMKLNWKIALDARSIGISNYCISSLEKFPLNFYFSVQPVCIAGIHASQSSSFLDRPTVSWEAHGKKNTIQKRRHYNMTARQPGQFQISGPAASFMVPCYRLTFYLITPSLQLFFFPLIDAPVTRGSSLVGGCTRRITLSQRARVISTNSSSSR